MYCVDIASCSSARGRQTTLRWQKRVYVNTRLSRAYLALARLSCFMSCQQLRHIRYWIFRKPLEIEAWFQRTTNKKWRGKIIFQNRIKKQNNSHVLKTFWSGFALLLHVHDIWSVTCRDNY